MNETVVIEGRKERKKEIEKEKMERDGERKMTRTVIRLTFGRKEKSIK